MSEAAGTMLELRKLFNDDYSEAKLLAFQLNSIRNLDLNLTSF